MEEPGIARESATPKSPISSRYDVFISHSIQDKAVAEAVCAAIESRGIRCWIAPRDIQAGADWGESILGAITSVKVMALVLSRHANASVQIKREVERAVHHRTTIIPLRIENVTPAQSLEYFLSTAQWVDAFTHPLEHHLQHIASAIQEVVTGQKDSLKSPAPAIRPRAKHKAGIAIGIVGAFSIIAAAVWWQTRPTQKTSAGPLSPTSRSAPATTVEAEAAAAPAQVSEKSIAVLPFQNLSKNEENAFFADGMQDEILTDLAKIADLKVISRTSVMQYKSGIARNLREIGKELGVANLLEGSVQRAGGKVRVNAQLIDARSDAHRWGQTYDRDLADVFAIQSEIAKTIADQLQAKISPSEKAAIEKAPTTNLGAYDLYLRAQALFADTTDPIHAREKLPQAAQLLDEAVARDPHFLFAWCLLAKVQDGIYWQGHDHTPARLDLANAAVQAALRLQPDAGEAHLALADYYYHGFRDYRRARSELAIARRTLPNSAEVFEYTGYIDRREGHWEEATRNSERAVELDPRNFFHVQQLALTYQSQHRYADTARAWDRALTIVPGDPNTRIARAEVAADWRADIKPYQTTLATVTAEDPSVAPDVDDPEYSLCERTTAAAARVLRNYPRDGVIYSGVSFPHAYWEGVVARWQGDSVKARSAFIVARSEVEKTVEKEPDFAGALSLLGMIDAGLGRKEEALREGRRACELLPISKDAIDGVARAISLAQIYAWTGENYLAIAQIEAVERVPNALSYGLLKLQPQWDSLRGDPRFEKIIASLAPSSNQR